MKKIFQSMIFLLAIAIASSITACANNTGLANKPASNQSSSSPTKTPKLEKSPTKKPTTNQSSSSDSDTMIIDLSHTQSLPLDISEHLTFPGQGGSGAISSKIFDDLIVEGFNPGETVRFLAFSETLVGGINTLNFIQEDYVTANNSGIVHVKMANHKGGGYHFIFIGQSSGKSYAFIETGGVEGVSASRIYSDFNLGTNPFGPNPENWWACDTGFISRFQANDKGYVSTESATPNNVRSNPGTSSKWIGELKAGEKFLVLEGPTCINKIPWWKVKSLETGLVGWTAEGARSKGTAEDYWLVPDN